MCVCNLYLVCAAYDFHLFQVEMKEKHRKNNSETKDTMKCAPVAHTMQLSIKDSYLVNLQAKHTYCSKNGA